ncbi:MAG: hypothetical protein LBT38_09965 [Deltaproteobacteria bacterium]|jgi:hypothetical protein|nr:hypothetical protein [Deltaproteobacteria bacterium]
MEFKYHPDDWLAQKGDRNKYVAAKLKSNAKAALRAINDKKYSESFPDLRGRVVEVGVGIYGEGEVLALFTTKTGQPARPKLD